MPKDTGGFRQKITQIAEKPYRFPAKP